MSKEQKKFQWKPNLFDLAVVVIGVAMMALIVLVLRPAAARVERTESIEFTIEVQNMPEGSWELVQAGDTLFDNVRKMQLGTVVSASAEPYAVPVSKVDGSAVVESVMPGYENILIVVRSDMTITNKEVQTVGGFTLRVGGSVDLRGPSYAGNGFVVAIERGEE